MSNTHPTVHVIVKYFFPVAAGIETNIMETYTYLTKLGWDVTVHTSTNTLTENDTLPQEENIRGLRVQRYPWTWYGFWPALPESADIVALHNCNIVPHIPLLFWWLICRSIGKKVPKIMITPHGGFTPEWRTFPKIGGTLKLFLHKTLYCWLLNRTADAIRAVSVWEQQEMISYGINAKKIVVISNGIENLAFENVENKVSSEWKKKVASFGSYLIQMGRIHPIKNFETTILALAKLPTEINFVIAGPVGDESYKQSLIELATSLGVEDRVIFAGVVRGPEKFYLLKEAICMVHMAMWESYCNVVHEGMSQGLVCVVANNTALPLLIKNGQNGFCVETRDTARLTEVLSRIIDPVHKKEMEAIEERNRMSVKEHSWDNVAKNMHALYTKLRQKV